MRPEPNGAPAESVRTPLPHVALLARSSSLDIGLAPARTAPATGSTFDAGVRRTAGVRVR
ncbi:hypothetical protein [Streptomyces minutiscleroticus]|uniref:Uncharacterized protein n=1 Tax=Streptomyces minutiscleroticus TaxID=68238 RepID=A0A918NDB0_9ACTN|nr:hypothetical protein [Streptomyces minutiscleroticus]GGX59095.1 hypothetical protein GCM10010358_11690 [Streptomyces minutiscleroticus]